MIEGEGFFWSPKLEGALEGEADERFRRCGPGRKRLPELQDLVVFGVVECVCGLTFEGWAGRHYWRACFRRSQAHENRPEGEYEEYPEMGGDGAATGSLKHVKGKT